MKKAKAEEEAPQTPTPTSTKKPKVTEKEPSKTPVGKTPSALLSKKAKADVETEPEDKEAPAKTPSAVSSKKIKVANEAVTSSKTPSTAVPKKDKTAVEQESSKTPAAAFLKAIKAAKGEAVKAAASKKEKSAAVPSKTPSKPAAEENLSAKSATKKRTLPPDGPKPTIDVSKRPGKAECKLAIDALLQHVHAYEKAKKQKLSIPGVSKEGQTVFLQIGLRGMPEQALKTFKGRPIVLPHPFRKLEGTSVCMLVKDKAEAKKWLGDDYEKHGIQKIISLEQLRKVYNSFQSRRELADMYDVFVADDRIVCMLPKALGKAFYVGAKRPLPIRLAQNEKLNGSVTTKIEKALRSAYFYLSGVSTSIRIGVSTQTADELMENAAEVLEKAVEHIPGKWKGVQAVFLKSEKSAALPIYERLAPAVDEE